MCASLGDSLQSSIQEKLGISLKGDATTTQNDSMSHTNNISSKHVKISEQELSAEEGEDSVRVSPDCRGHRRERLQRDNDDNERCAVDHQSCQHRPKSLPSLYLKDNSSELIERLQALRLREGQEGNWKGDVNGRMRPQEVRLRSKSQDDCCYRDCRTQQQQQHQHSRNSRGSQNRYAHQSSKRRRGGRPPTRDRSGRVDVSLDDNCPGLPQNRVTRRSRHHHHHHHHQHAVCDRCLESLDKDASPPHRRHRHRQVQSPTGEEVMVENQDNHYSKSGEGEGEGLTADSFMTLQDMKAKGTNDLDESVIQDLKMQFLRGMEEQRKHKSKSIMGNGHRSFRLDAVQPCLSRNQPRTKTFHVATKGGNWHQLAFPTEPRTGQDSPRTDMAVINLDLNGPQMCQPLVISDPSSMRDLPTAIDGHVGTGHLYLHNHHHIHHIIHHSQP